VSDAGGAPRPLTRLEKGEVSHGWPEFLPGGKRFLFLRFTEKPDIAGIYTGSLDGTPSFRVLPDLSNVNYVPPASPGRFGYLLFRREGTLMAQPFDLDRLQASGEMFPVADQVGTAVNTGTAAFSTSANGALAYWSGGTYEDRQFVWMDRTGKQLGAATKPAYTLSGRLSPDEKRLAFSIRTNPTTADIWLQDLARGVTSRFSFDPGTSSAAVWSPDGSRVAFSGSTGANYFIREKATSGAEKEELLKAGGLNVLTWDWSPDAKFLVYSEYADKTKDDLWLLPPEGDHKPIPYLQTAFSEIHGQFSPDGRWMAYTSDESGKLEVYVQAIPASGSKWQVSTSGGRFPRWRRDGKELFYVSADQKLMAVPVKSGGVNSGSFEPGPPQPLFPIEPPPANNSFPYQSAGDGQRFLVSIRVGEGLGAVPITVVLNWQTELRK